MWAALMELMEYSLELEAQEFDCRRLHDWKFVAEVILTALYELHSWCMSASC